MDGRADLLDFAPLWLDLSRLLSQLGDATQYEFRLSQKEDAVNLVWTPFSHEDAGGFLKHPVMLCGETFDDYVHEAQTIRVTKNGIVIPISTLNQIQTDSNKGIFLIEGSKTTTHPLVLSCYRKSHSIWKADTLLFEMKLPLSISPVESMYRWINLREVAQEGDVERETDIETPLNLPDTETKNLNVFFLHGFNVTEAEARGWHSEMFKRLRQSGSNARYWSVVWNGDAGLINAFKYQENVYNAFVTAPYLANYLNTQVAGPKIVLAHSLGNMVVSSAIQDHGMTLSKYFMLNAAIPSEAFDSSQFNDSPLNPLVHDLWRGYTNRTWSCKWNEHFTAPDDRRKLTWKGRFSHVLPYAYNFYSTGDEVFELYHQTPSPETGGTTSKGRYAWHKQESYKGRASNVRFAFAVTNWSGWGFRQAPCIVGEEVIWTNCFTASMAASIPPNALTTNTVFRL